MIGFWTRLLITALGLWLASGLVSGIAFSGPLSLLVAALVFGFVNALIRPIVILFTLPITILTLGLFLLVVNAAMLGLTAAFVPGFLVTGFWPALFGSIIVSITGALASWYIGPNGKVEILIVKRR